MEQQVTKQLLLSSNYWVLNKDMVKMLGLETAFLLSNFAEAETMMADDDGWFYQTVATIEKTTTLSRHKQDHCITQLEEKGILEKEVRGIPPRRYFKINHECLTNQFVKNLQINIQNSDKSICKKSATNKESSYKELDYKESNIIMTPTEAEYISILENIKDYPLDREKDLEYMKLLIEKYPTLDILKAVKNFSIYILDKPFKKNSNHRSQLNNSFSKYVEWGKCLKEVKNDKPIEIRKYRGVTTF